MYARQVSVELKPDSRIEFTQMLESEILPLLRKQKGFKDEISFVNPEGDNAFAISLWDDKESARAYSHGPYAEVTKILSKLVQGSPRVRTFEVANSTFHNIAAKLKAA
jgi:heme-degrading monooxygenase HmoA